MGGQLWAKIALNLAENPKVIGLSDRAFRAFIEGILYSRKHMTDGFLDARVVNKLWGLEAAEELCTNDPSNPSWVAVEGGFVIHAFCEYQMTSGDVEKHRELQRQKGIKSGEARRAKLEPNRTENEPAVEPNANRNELESESESETETDTSEAIKVVISEPTTRKTKLSLDWKPNEKGFAYALEKAPAMNVALSVDQFINYNLQRGRTSADWDAAWRNWVIKAVEFDPQLAKQPPPPKRIFGQGGDNDV